MSSKMNVLHLHLLDSQSVPLRLASYPNITLYGAYSEDQVCIYLHVYLCTDCAYFPFDFLCLYYIYVWVGGWVHVLVCEFVDYM